jgi:hypothetical protein
MPAFYEIRFLSKGEVKMFAGIRGVYYELADSVHLDVYNIPVWCRTCNEFSHGENLRTLESIDEKIRSLRDPKSPLYQMTRYGMVEELTGNGAAQLESSLAELHKRRRWRESRMSAAKCLHCGTTEIVPLPLDQPIPNPQGEGEIELSMRGMCSTEFNEWFYTPEGDRIPRDSRPTYWHHPVYNQPHHLKKLKECFGRR